MSIAMKNVLVLGGSGLLGQAIIYSLKQKGVNFDAPNHETLDVLNFAQLAEYISKIEPDFIFNCVGYTQVDKAESEAEQAMLLNRDLPVELAKIVKGTNSFLLHYSTDYVFDGLKTTPYTPEDDPAPLNVYGASKLAGEEEIKRLNVPNCAIIRTAWLFGPGKKNFIQTILSVCNQQGCAKVVHDQVGSPTYTRDLAKYSLALAEKRKGGIFHIVNAGEASWCELAAEAVRHVLGEYLVEPIKSEDLKQAAMRPSFSVLDTSSFTSTTGIKPRIWISALTEYMAFDEINDLIVDREIP